MAIVQNKGTTELYHYGTPRHSGRYPYGSGENSRAYLEDHGMTYGELNDNKVKNEARTAWANKHIKNGDWTIGKDDGSIDYHLRNMVHSYYKTGEPYDLTSVKISLGKMDKMQLSWALNGAITDRKKYISDLQNKYGYSEAEAKRTVSKLTDALMTEAKAKNIPLAKTMSALSYIPGTKAHAAAKDMAATNDSAKRETRKEKKLRLKDEELAEFSKNNIPSETKSAIKNMSYQNLIEMFSMNIQMHDQLRREYAKDGYRKEDAEKYVNALNRELWNEIEKRRKSESDGVQHEYDANDIYQEGKPKRSGRNRYGSGYNPRAWLRDHNMTLAEYQGRDDRRPNHDDNRNRHGNDGDNRNEHHNNQQRNDGDNRNESRDNQPKEEPRKLTLRERHAEKKAAKRKEAERKEKERIIRSGSVKKVKKNLVKLTNRELEDAIQRAKLVKDLKHIKRDSRVVGIADRMERTAGMFKSGIKLYNLSADIQNAFNAHREEADKKKDWVHVSIFKTDGDKRNKNGNKN